MPPSRQLSATQSQQPTHPDWAEFLDTAGADDAAGNAPHSLHQAGHAESHKLMSVQRHHVDESSGPNAGSVDTLHDSSKPGHLDLLQSFCMQGFNESTNSV